MSLAQKIYSFAWLFLLALWLGLKLGVPIYEYAYGANGLTALLQTMAPVVVVAALILGASMYLLQRIGVLPIVQNQASDDSTIRPLRLITNLVVWIVIAVILVFFFNLLQGGPNHAPLGGDIAKYTASHADLMNVLINAIPIVLMVGFWIFIMWRMQAKNKDKDKS